MGRCSEPGVCEAGDVRKAAAAGKDLAVKWGTDPGGRHLTSANPMTGNEIREQFLRFFEQEGHRRVPSSSLVPAGDPTLLFANAGMNQFKEVFLGKEARSYRRATTSQKCVRAGGKHNDLENVGRTRRHHTFFEMLGNFSFGDYFKAEAIDFAWRLVTRVYGLPRERLWITVYEQDDEAEDLWKRIAGVPADRIWRCGTKDNFWQMGDTGPCGPCSEIFYDYGPEGLEPGEADDPFPADVSRYVEIWNLVFMEFDRHADGTLHRLPKPSIDTGMGLERTAAVLQGKLSNFETDLFLPILERAGEILGFEYGASPRSDVVLRIVADHSRAAAFLINDGVVPTNEGRGYVLRKIIRRALRHSRLAGFDGLFLRELTGFVSEMVKPAYPELCESAERVGKIVQDEELRYARSYVIAEREFESALGKVVNGTIPGSSVFRLYDTFGLSLDEQQEMAQERGLRIDLDGFETEMQAQRARARSSWKGGVAATAAASPALVGLADRCKTEFIGYDRTQGHDLRVIGLVQGDNEVEVARAGEQAEVVLDRTPFYAEAGGQVGDRGSLMFGSEDAARVLDVQAPVRATNVHIAEILHDVAMGDRLSGSVDTARRAAVRRNHTATHLLHAALRQVLGTHVKQAGSVVDPERLRFDVTHFAMLEPGEIEEIEHLVNEHVLADVEVVTRVTDLEQAIQGGAMALFGEKYQDRVRVVSIGDFSQELCGGTHVQRTGEIGVFKLVAEGSSAAGVRRIEALTGYGALQQFRDLATTAQRMAAMMRGREDTLVDGLDRLLSERRRLDREVKDLKTRLARAGVAELAARARDIDGLQVVAAKVDNVGRQQLRPLADALRARIGSGLVVLATVRDGRVALVAAATRDVAGSRVHAGNVVRNVARLVGGGGGGRPDMAEAGGRNPGGLPAALAQVYELVRRQT